MLRAVSAPGLAPSKTSAEQTFDRPSSAQPPNKFGTVVRALWPDKPALNLAQRIGCTERGAQYIIDGKRKVSARAVIALLNELT